MGDNPTLESPTGRPSGISNDVSHRLKELEKDNQELRQQNQELRAKVEAHSNVIAEIKRYIVGEDDLHNAGDLEHSIEQELADIRNEIEQEKKTRSKHDSRIERRVGTIAEETGVDLSDTKVAGEDKIKRLIVHGPEDIADRVYDVHERAREILLHAGEWGHTANDKFGRRVSLRSTDVRERLELARQEDLTSTEVRRAFEKIVELAEDSPRTARLTQNGEGINQLVISLGDDQT